MEDRAGGALRKTITVAIESFNAQREGKGAETKRKYKRILDYLKTFCEDLSLTFVDQVGVESMDRYDVWRQKDGSSWIKEREILVQFFEFCRDRGWTTKNPATSLRRPRMLEANDVVPYTRNEIIQIIAACDEIGKTNYERRRARAMVVLMRYAGLRISDVVTLTSGSESSYLQPCMRRWRCFHYRWARPKVIDDFSRRTAQVCGALSKAHGGR
jgi:site-specific recombinase XerD